MKRDELGMALCKAFGLDNLTVTRMVIDIDAGSLPTVTVKFLPTDWDADVIVNEVKRYYLTGEADA